MAFKKSEFPAQNQIRLFVNTPNPKEIFMASIDPVATMGSHINHYLKKPKEFKFFSRNE